MEQQYELNFNENQLIFLKDVIFSLHKEAVRIEKVLLGKAKDEIKTKISLCDSILEEIRGKLNEIECEKMSD